MAQAEERSAALRAEILSLRRELSLAREGTAREQKSHRQTQLILQTIVDTLDPIWIGWKDLDSIYLGCNRMLAQQAGLSPPAAIAGKSDYDLPWKREESDFYRKIDRQVMDSNTPLSNIIEPVHGASGILAWIRTNKAPLHDEEGRVMGLVYTIEDITSRKQQEQDLAAERSLTSAVLNTTTLLVAVLDKSGLVIRVNPACEKVTGYTLSLLKDKPFLEIFVAPEEASRIEGLFDELLRGLGPNHFESSLTAKDGTKRLYAWNATTVAGDGGAVDHVVVTGLDITELRRAESERAALAAQVIDAQRAALRELGTPLIPIADGVLIMPLIGIIDEQRAEQMIDTLLKGVLTYRAETVILDITGVEVADTHVSNVFVHAAKTVRLLGAQVMLTGVKPKIAETLVRMGVDLSGVQTLGSLQAGIAAALNKR